MKFLKLAVNYTYRKNENPGGGKKSLDFKFIPKPSIPQLLILQILEKTLEQIIHIKTMQHVGAGNLNHTSLFGFRSVVQHVTTLFICGVHVLYIISVKWPSLARILNYQESCIMKNKRFISEAVLKPLFRNSYLDTFLEGNNCGGINIAYDDDTAIMVQGENRRELEEKCTSTKIYPSNYVHGRQGLRQYVTRKCETPTRTV